MCFPLCQRRYERLKTIGRGRSGVVHLARVRMPKEAQAQAEVEGGVSPGKSDSEAPPSTPRKDKYVALKRLHSKLSANAGGAGQDGVLTEATREVQILSTLKHPNVIGLKVGAVGIALLPRR